MNNLFDVVKRTNIPAGDPSRHIAPSIGYQVHPVGGGGESVVPPFGSSGAPIGGAMLS
jgi:hypothetical protein